MSDRRHGPAEPGGSYWHVNVTTALVVLLAHAVITTRLPEDVRTLTRVLLFAAIALTPRWPRSWTLWGLLAGILAFELARAPFDLPNHHYALTYITLAMALSLSASESEDAHLRTGARWILVAIMGWATLQKATSARFMDGSYMGYILATGGFAQPLTVFCESCRAAIESNIAAVAEFRSVEPDAGAAIVLASPFPRLTAVAQAFGISILAFEAWLALAFAALPDRRPTHWSLLVFAAGLGVLRSEYLFISVVCLLGLLSCGRDLVWERRAYALGAIVFAAGAIS